MPHHRCVDWRAAGIAVASIKLALLTTKETRGDDHRRGRMVVAAFAGRAAKSASLERGRLRTLPSRNGRRRGRRRRKDIAQFAGLPANCDESVFSPAAGAVARAEVSALKHFQTKHALGLIRSSLGFAVRKCDNAMRNVAGPDSIEPGLALASGTIRRRVRRARLPTKRFGCAIAPVYASTRT